MIPRDWRVAGEAAFATQVFSGPPDPIEHFFTAVEAGMLHWWHENLANEQCFDAFRAQAPGFVQQTVAAILALESRQRGHQRRLPR